MQKELVINAQNDQISIALLEDKNLVELNKDTLQAIRRDNLKNVYVDSMSTWLNLKFADDTANPMKVAENLDIQKAMYLLCLFSFLQKVSGEGGRRNQIRARRQNGHIGKIRSTQFHHFHTIVERELAAIF